MREKLLQKFLQEVLQQCAAALKEFTGRLLLSLSAERFEDILEGAGQ